jgi:NADPH:quinone reductase-like Zn-dependent oxidoreductase
MMLYKRATLAGIGVGSRRALEDFVRAVGAIGLKPVIDQVYGFDSVPTASDHMNEGAFGKVSIRVS